MKRLFLFLSVFSFIILTTFTTYSCDKVSDNGDLDGMWQFMTITYARNGVYDSTVNAKDYKAYLSFQLDLARISWRNVSITDATKNILCRFNHQGNTLQLHDFYLDFAASDSLITDANTLLLTPLGIKGNNVTFTVLEENKNSLILQSDYARIVLRKF